MQLEQQKTQLTLITLLKNLNTLQGYKRYMKIFEFEINNLCIQILAAKMT